MKYYFAKHATIHTQFEELEIDELKAEEYYKKEEINKLTECNFCCKPIRKRQEIINRPTYRTHQQIYHRTRYEIIISSYDKLDDQFNDSDKSITNQDIIMEPEKINNTEEQDQVIADIATQNLDYDYKPKELDAKTEKRKQLNTKYTMNHN
ncbi:25895_t:CDS:2 [Racocetra persica]|uniref:25895_t:CDS:1 n=1 Tax=Racocetra persica TaxID=160502 RepID=A0ACA9R7X2_9GLOM|nr:25895_t:CDS:2 [Racocetra persica]